MILCVGATPAIQRVMVFDELTIDSVNRAARTLEDIAGKSINVAKVLKSLGATPFAAGILGGDRGAQLASTLRAKQIQSDFIAVEARTRECITVIDKAAGTQTELVEESLPVPAEVYDKLLEVVSRHVSQARAL